LAQDEAPWLDDVCVSFKGKLLSVSVFLFFF